MNLAGAHKLLSCKIKRETTDCAPMNNRPKMSWSDPPRTGPAQLLKALTVSQKLAWP